MKLGWGCSRTKTLLMNYTVITERDTRLLGTNKKKPRDSLLKKGPVVYTLN